MGAPAGNRNGVGHGRPPEPHNLTKEELHELGRELINWTKSEDFKKAVHIDEFPICIKGMTWKQWKLIIQRDCFKEYYDTAKKCMAFNLLRNKDMHDSMGNRYLCFYDRDLRDHEREIKMEEAELKAKDSSSFLNFAENLAKMNEFFEKVQSMQALKNSTPALDHKD